MSIVKKLLVPYAHLIIKTRLGAGEVLQKLDNVIAPASLLGGLRPKHKPYEGVIWGYSFSAHRLVWNNTAFMHTIKGEIHPETGGCSVHIRMHPNIFTLVVLTIWLGLFGCTFVGRLLEGIFATIENQSLQPSLVTAICPAIFFLAGYGLLVGTFLEELGRAKRFFRKLFQAYQLDEV